MLHMLNNLPMDNSKDSSKEESLYRKWDISISMKKKIKLTKMVNNKLSECNNYKKIHLLKYSITPIQTPNLHFNMPTLINTMKIIKNNNLATIKMLLEDSNKLQESSTRIKSFKNSKLKVSPQVLCNNWEKTIKEK